MRYAAAADSASAAADVLEYAAGTDSGYAAVYGFADAVPDLGRLVFAADPVVWQQQALPVWPPG